jgi:hypothetical protein
MSVCPFFLEYIKHAHHVEPNQSLPLINLTLVKESIFIFILQYPNLYLSLLVALSTRRNLDDTLNHHPTMGTLQ